MRKRGHCHSFGTFRITVVWGLLSASWEFEFRGRFCEFGAIGSVKLSLKVLQLQIHRGYGFLDPNKISSATMFSQLIP